MKIVNLVTGITIEVTPEEIESLSKITDWYDCKAKTISIKLLDTIDKFLSNTNSKK